MNRELALLTLGCTDDDHDEIQNCFDEKLFEIKQFLLGNTPIKKVFQLKLEKLHKLFDAFNFLISKTISSIPIERVEVKANTLDDLLSAQQRVKLLMHQSENEEAIVYYTNTLIEIEHVYEDLFLEKFKFFETQGMSQTEHVPISKKADIMHVYSVWQIQNFQDLMPPEKEIIQKEYFRIKNKQQQNQ